MQAVTEAEIRTCFVNCSKGEAKRLNLPRGWPDWPWEDVDFLGWPDPAGSGRAYLVIPQEDELVGVALRHEPNSSRKSQMCAICLTTHSRGGVLLMTAAKTGDAGRRGSSIGTYMCADLGCSLYVRGKKQPALGLQYREDLSTADKIDRLRGNLAAFVTALAG